MSVPMFKELIRTVVSSNGIIGNENQSRLTHIAKPGTLIASSRESKILHSWKTGSLFLNMLITTGHLDKYKRVDEQNISLTIILTITKSGRVSISGGTNRWPSG